ncbi:MAG: phage tail protein [Gammaproteobacteria bacterium]
MKFEPGRSTVKDPYLNFRFNVEIDGIAVAGFSEVSGLTFETAVESFREGGFNAHERQLAGPSKCPDRLILKRGLSGNELWLWYGTVLSGKPSRKKQITIALRDFSGADVPKWRWVFLQASPVKWTGPQFRAGTAEVAFETIELIHKGLMLKQS